MVVYTVFPQTRRRTQEATYQGDTPRTTATWDATQRLWSKIMRGNPRSQHCTISQQALRKAEVGRVRKPPHGRSMMHTESTHAAEQRWQVLMPVPKRVKNDRIEE